MPKKEDKIAERDLQDWISGRWLQNICRCITGCVLVVCRSLTRYLQDICYLVVTVSITYICFLSFFSAFAVLASIFPRVLTALSVFSYVINFMLYLMLFFSNDQQARFFCRMLFLFFNAFLPCICFFCLVFPIFLPSSCFFPFFAILC